MLAIRGGGSAIAQSLVALLPPTAPFVCVDRSLPLPLDAGRYLFAAGVLIGKPAADQEPEEVALAWRVNFDQVKQDCDRIIDANDHTRICVIGSESGFAGSYDEVYAESKAALHRYVETKRLRTPDQQLICIAPTIIEDAGMTLRRQDTEVLAAKRQAHPKRRFLKADEVARLIHYLLYVDRGYLSGTVIRMHGGNI